MAHKIDLKPLTEETITQMGYNNHDLWLVKLGSVVYGPFEAESLKHYVTENEELFEEAEASRADETEWNPFWAYTKFQRRKFQGLSNVDNHEGPFWIMDFGLKKGPFSFHEIDKKIEMGLLVMTDHISVNDGHSWVKIYEVPGFDRRSHSPDDLPVAPYESSFQKAKLELVEKMEEPHINTIDEMAELAWQGHQNAKVIPFKIDEMTLRNPDEIVVSPALKWAIPSAAALLVTIVTSGYFLFSPDTEEVIADLEPEEKPFYQKKVVAKKPRPVPKAVIPSARPEPARVPASTGYSQPEQHDFRSRSRYPTKIVTHEEFRAENDPQPERDPYYQDRDPLADPVADAEAQPEVHSLVNEREPAAQDQGIDGAMTGDDYGQPVDNMDRPVVDEASDF